MKKIVCIIFVDNYGNIIPMPMFVVVCKDINSVGEALQNSELFVKTIYSFSECIDTVLNLIGSMLNGLIYGNYDMCTQRHGKGLIIIKYYNKCTSKYLPEEGCNRLLCTISYDGSDNKCVFELNRLSKKLVLINKKGKCGTRSIVIGKCGWAEFRDGNVSSRCLTYGTNSIYMKIVNGCEVIVCRNKLRHEDFLSRVKYVISIL
jgi:hypothetical protein